MRVLILAHDFPPLNTIGARRPYSWFNYFPENGIHPIVITKSWEEASGSVQQIAMQKGKPENIVEERSDRTLIKVPQKKLRPDRLLMRYGYSRFAFLRKALTLINLILAYPFHRFDKNATIYRAANDFLKKNKVDYIVATGEPFILFKHAYLLGKKYKIPWVADYRDGWKVNHVTALRRGIASKFLGYWEFIFEKKYIAGCSFISTVDPLLAEKLSVLHHKKSVVVYNGIEEFYPVTVRNEVQKLPLILCHSGTVYPGHQVEVLLQALHELDSEKKITPEDLKLQFVGIEFFPDQLKRIMSYSSAASKYVQTTERLSRSEASKFNFAADFLVVFTDSKQPVIPAKTYEYVSSNRPIVVVLNDHSILAELIEGLNAGILLDSLAEVKIFLLEKIQEKKNNQPLFTLSLNKEKALFYTRKMQTTHFASFLLSQRNSQ